MDFLDYCENGDINNIKQMSLKGCNLDCGFRWACWCGHYDIVRYLCELYKTGEYEKINIHAGDEEGFRLACYKEHYNIVQYLCELYKTGDYTKINIHAHTELGFRWACMNGKYEILYFLMTLYKKHQYKPIHNFIRIFKKIDKYLI